MHVCVCMCVHAYVCAYFHMRAHARVCVHALCSVRCVQLQTLLAQTHVGLIRHGGKGESERLASKFKQIHRFLAGGDQTSTPCTEAITFLLGPAEQVRQEYITPQSVQRLIRLCVGSWSSVIGSLRHHTVHI